MTKRKNRATKWQSKSTTLTLMALAFLCGYSTALLGVFDSFTGEVESYEVKKIQPLTSTNHEKLDTRLANKNLNEPQESEIKVIQNHTSESFVNPVEAHFQSSDSYDAISMLNKVIILSEMGNYADQGEIAEALDSFKNLLATSPYEQANLIDHMRTLSFESKEFHHIVSILQELPEHQGSLALTNVALELSQNDDIKSQEQFLLLAANLNNNIENPRIQTALADIAIYAEDSEHIVLDALTLLKPFHMDDYEKEQVLTRINNLLATSNTTNHSQLINNALKFSNNEEREHMATQFIDSNYDIETRHEILSGLHTGIVPRSNQIKELLLNIASNQSDPLNQAAQGTLKELFYITYQEYKQIKN